MDVNKFIKNEIRTVIEFTDNESEKHDIVIKNPTNKIKEKFLMEMDEKESDNFKPIEILINELTNVELSEPLKNMYDRDYLSNEFYLLLKEIISIALEIVDEYVIDIDAQIELQKIEKKVLDMEK